MTARQMAEAACRAADGDELAFVRLCRQFERLLQSEARRLYAPGLGFDDLLQEARVGLYKATLAFDPGRGVAFPAIAQVAIRRNVISAVKTATRGKCGPLNGAVSFEVEHGAEGSEGRLEDVLSDGRDVLDVLLERERMDVVLGALAGLSELERVSLLETDRQRGPHSSSSYAVLAGRLGCSVKAVDNARQRAVKKLTRRLAA